MSLSEQVIANLVTEALADLRSNSTSRRALVSLHQSATEPVFLAAAHLCESDVADQRLLGCEILAELGPGWGRPFAASASALLRGMAVRERDSRVLSEIIHALGGQHLPDNRDAIVAYVANEDPRVRNAVASSLVVAADSLASQHDEVALKAVLRLCDDSDADVRASAVWVLAEETPISVPGVEEALARIADDPDESSVTRSVARDALDRARRGGVHGT